MSITSDENKELLSQILVNHPLKQQNPEGFDKFLDTQLKTIHQSRFKYNNNLTAMNKEVLRIFQTMVPPRSSLEKVQIQRQRAWASGGTGSEPEPVPKIKIFETRLKEQQDHFNSMIKAETPPEIDFSDKVDDSENASLDDTMQQRQAELQKIMSSYQKQNAEAWIKGDSVKPDNIKISPSVLKKDTKPRIEKRVSFQINEKNDTDSTEVDTQSLFNKLKIKAEDLTDKEEMKSEENPRGKDQIDYTPFFKTMISNQEQIIKLLQLKQGEH